MRLSELFPGFVDEAGDGPVTGITADSRAVRPGFVFAALQGVAADGRRFAPNAIEAGAIAVVGNELPDLAVTTINVDEPRLELARAAARFYRAQPEKIVAVTGTNGKSSTVDFLRQIWSSAGIRAASMGTLGAIGPSGHVDLGHTTPDPVAIHATLAQLVADKVSHVAMEASSHGLSQYRLDAVTLSAVAFTNLTQDHLDYHQTMDEYRQAKLRLFSELAAAGADAVINADSDENEIMTSVSQQAGLNVVSVGWRGHDLKINELMPRQTGQRLFFSWKGQSGQVDLPLIGEFQALNALMAAALALASGLDLAMTIKGLSALEPVKGRLEYVGRSSAGGAVFVDYAHTAAGLDVLIRAARPHTAGRLIVIIGCGGDRDKGKRSQMGAVAAKHADLVIVTDDNPRTEDPAAIRRQILSAVPGGLEVADRGEAITSAIRDLRSGDTLLIAGKGHETGQIIGDQIIPFSDQETALAALRGGDHV